MALLLMTLGSRAQPCLRMDDAFTNSSLAGCLSVLTDSSNTLTIHRMDLTKFRSITSGRPNFRTDGLSHWITFTCQNNTVHKKQFVVDIDIVYADEMSFYVLDGQTIIRQIEHNSWHDPTWKRVIPSRYFAFPLNLAPFQVVRVYIRAQEHTGTLLMPVTVWEKSAHETHELTQTIAFATPVATLIFLALVSLILFLFFPNVIWLFYAGHALGTAVYTLNIEGFMAHYAPAPFNHIKGYAMGVSFSWIANLLFTQHFVYKRLNTPVWWLIPVNQAAVVLQTGWLLYLLVTPFQGHSAGTALVMTALTAGFILVCLLVCLVRGSYEARFYIVAITPFLVSILIRVLASANLITTQTWHYYARYYTPLFEIIVLGVGSIRYLIREREHTLTQLDNAQKEVISAQETERQRLAADLHDDIGTSLVALRGRLTLNPDAEHLLNKIINDVRMVSHNLLPIELHDLGLPDALCEVARRLETASDIRFLFVCSGERVMAGPVADLVLYRVGQELMHNIVRHSQATEAVVQLVYHTHHLNITVEDNGRGMANQKLNKDAGIGLQTIHSRIKTLNGTVAIDTGPTGTTVRIDVPYPGQTNGRHS